MIVLPRREHDLSCVARARLRHRIALLALHRVADGRMRVHDDLEARERVLLPANLAQDLVTDRGLALELAGPVAVEARLVERAAERLARALARHLDEAELADPHDCRLR